jgi:hypothetical protein
MTITLTYKVEGKANEPATDQDSNALYAFLDNAYVNLDALSIEEFDGHVADFRRRYVGTHANKLDWMRTVVANSEGYEHVTSRSDVRRMLASFTASNDIYFLKTADGELAAFRTQPWSDEFACTPCDIEWKLAQDDDGVYIAYANTVRYVKQTFNGEDLLKAFDAEGLS